MTCRQWTQAEKDYLAEIVPGRSHREILKLMNERFEHFQLGQIEAAIKRYGLNTGRTGQFEKGSVPATKGKTWDEFMSPEAQARCRQTTYSSGNKPHNHRPIGSERVDKDGYIWVKVKDHYDPEGYNDWRDLWIPKHRHIWEQAHGKLPKGSIVVFLDGDISNFDVDNLASLTKAENVVINKTGLRYHDRLTFEAAVNTVRLMSRIHKVSCHERSCMACGKIFEPEQPRQRRCRRCIDENRGLAV